jgi:hypothetical protein
MKEQLNRWLVWLMIVLGSGTLFQVLTTPPGFTNQHIPDGGCGSFYAHGAVSGVDFCFLLNCDNGFFGGLVQPCGDPNNPDDDLLVDCGAGVGTADGDEPEPEPTE